MTIDFSIKFDPPTKVDPFSTHFPMGKRWPGAEVAGIQSWFGSRLAEGGGLGRRSTQQLNYTVQKLMAGNPKKKLVVYRCFSFSEA